MTAESSTERQEWYQDYIGRLEAGRREWHSTAVAKIKTRQPPEEEQAERIVIFPAPNE